MRTREVGIGRRLGDDDRKHIRAGGRLASVWSWRQIGYSVIRTVAPECFSNRQCSPGVSL